MKIGEGRKGGRRKMNEGREEEGWMEGRKMKGGREDDEGR